MTFMPRSDEGEFELVLGKKQFLSVLFMVVILVGLFFTMGYIVGRNSAPMADTTVAQRVVRESPSAPVPGPRTAATTPIEVPKPKKVSDGAGNLGKEKAQELVRPDPKIYRLGQITPGETYLQVAAAIRPEAELLASVLRRKGFLQAVVVPGPSEVIFRVVVGPIRNPDALAKTRADLAAAGFESLIRKY